MIISYSTISYLLCSVRSKVCLQNLQPLHSKLSRSSYFSQASLFTVSWPTLHAHAGELASFLIPRPSHCPVFDRLQYAIMWMTSASTLVDRGRGGIPNWTDTFRAHTLHFEPGVVGFLICEHLKLQHLGQKLQDNACFYWIGDPSPPSVYPGKQNVIHVIKWTRPPLSTFAGLVMRLLERSLERKWHLSSAHGAQSYLIIV